MENLDLFKEKICNLCFSYIDLLLFRVSKDICGISVVRGEYDTRLKRYNLAELGVSGQLG